MSRLEISLLNVSIPEMLLVKASQTQDWMKRESVCKLAGMLKWKIVNLLQWCC